MNDCTKLVNFLEEAASSTLPNAVRSKEAKLWDDDPELTQLRNLRNATDRNTKPAEFKAITKKLRKRFNQSRNLHYNGEAEKLDEAYDGEES